MVASASAPITASTFTSATATAACPAGSVLVGGGEAVTVGGALAPNDGSVVLGGVPAGTVDPGGWVATGAHSGQGNASDVLSAAMCATGVASTTEVVTASSPAGSLGPVTATCPAGTSLVGGGGGYTQIVNGTNTKLYDSYPSDSTGAVAPRQPNSWTVAGNSNVAGGGSTSVTTAAAVCATDVPVATVVATADAVAAPVQSAQAVAATATCPAGTTLLGGGSEVTNDPAGAGSGGQGVHLVGDVPSDASGHAATSGTAGSWTVTAEDGGQMLNSLTTTALVLCTSGTQAVATPQTISFPAPSPGVVGGSATLAATGGGSGNPVTFSVDPATPPGTCTVGGPHGQLVTYAAAGTCTIDANQAGSATYSAAAQVTQAVPVRAVGAKQPQAIVFSVGAPGVVGTSVTLHATGGGSGNPVTFTVDPSGAPGTCSVGGPDGATLRYLAAGACTVDANQAGDADFNPAAQVTQTIAVHPAAQPPQTTTTTTTVPGTVQPVASAAAAGGPPSGPGGATGTGVGGGGQGAGGGEGASVAGLPRVEGIVIAGAVTPASLRSPTGVNRSRAPSPPVAPGTGLGEGAAVAVACVGLLAAGAVLELRRSPVRRRSAVRRRGLPFAPTPPRTHGRP